ncbi:MAG: DnaA N-terminal domain-containing protein [Lactobacillus johnsonii]|uniref:DnaA N-terminal domain-containing protein n=1 Tax=uncultured Clostridium sp. TaxID=59620 RepID=UPI000820E907|nr:DnaA N-terminal domain-containing protein [uncultured Clostridium sp.]MDY4500805.1 DnaA N-terminal domain-containing protein [Lactobacillus johnsonii]SCJ95831.1 Uncharacterised protein [uncultured Clostridium sp.]
METNIKTDSTVIKRVVKEAKYAQIDNDLINNRELSFKALGIMTYILSKPDDWQIYISDLCRDKDGEKSVRAGLNELKDKKYMQRYRVYDMDTGKVHHWETLVSETPFEDSEIISSVKEKYFKDTEGKIVNKKIKIKSFERSVPIVIEREITLLSQKGKVENKNKNFLLSQNVQVENLQVENAGQQILNPFTNTDPFTKTDISSNSKGENSHISFQNRYEKIIGKKLGATTLPKFQGHIKNFRADLIESILVYAEETNARTYQWFEDRINDCLRKGITTGEQFTDDINAYREKQRQAKNRAIKEKEEAKNLDNAIEAAQEREIDEVISKEIEITDGIEVLEIKENIKDIVSSTVFNAWIAPNRFLNVNGDIVMVCRNELTKGVIERKYYSEICNILKTNGFNEELVLNVENIQ